MGLDQIAFAAGCSLLPPARFLPTINSTIRPKFLNVSSIHTSMTGNAHIEGRLLLATCKPNRGIGFNNTLPWPHLPSDMKCFKAVTHGSAVLMGSAAYSALPAKSRPLPGRLNIVLSSKRREQLGYPDEVIIAGSFDAAAQLLVRRGISIVYVIGGEKVYEQAIQMPQWSTRVYYTEICNEFDCDRFFHTDIDSHSEFQLVSLSADIEENGVKYRMKEYVRRKSGDHVSSPAQEVNVEEMQYLNLVRRILDTGVRKGDRTGTGTMSLFGAQMRFSLRESFPLLTTKRVFWRGVVEELLWFIRGSTNANELAEKNVRIWDGNGSREFLDQRGFTKRDVGDLGPVYGFQWRHFGAEYTDMYANYDGKGVDQLTEVIECIKNNPEDRRIIMSAWNPSALKDMALPPCHVLAQFYVANGELSCQMYQRSCDMGLGVPFNIASYSLLTVLIAEVTGLRAGDFVHVLGDAHVYSNHVEQLRVQVERTPRKFPRLEVTHRDDIEAFTMDDLKIVGYEPHEAIKMKMAV